MASRLSPARTLAEVGVILLGSASRCLYGAGGKALALLATEYGSKQTKR